MIIKRTRRHWITLSILLAALLAPLSAFGTERTAGTAAAAEEMIVVRGTVIDADEHPVVGFKVVVRLVDSAEVFFSNATAENGEYAVPLPAGGEYVVVAVISPGGTRLALEGQQPFLVTPGVRRDVVADVAALPAPLGERWPFPGADRLFISFVEDTSTVQRFRWESQFEVADQDAGSLLVARVLAAVQFYSIPDIEFGARLGYEGLNGSSGVPDGAGISDLDLWAKFHLGPRWLRNADFSFGGLVTLPTGSEDNGQSFDAMRSKLFFAMRYRFSSFMLAAHGGIWFNENGTLGGATLNGQTAPALGVAVLFPMSERLVVIGEAKFEGERFSGVGDDARLLGGVNWKPLPWGSFRLALSAGLTDGAPDAQFLGSWMINF